MNKLRTSYSGQRSTGKNTRTPFRDHSAESALFIRRAVIAGLLISLLSAILIANLYHLQISQYKEYKTRSNDNRIKLLPISPSRGIIYDRNGIAIALNRTIYQLEVRPEKVVHLASTLQQLKSIIGLTDEDIANFIKEKQKARRFTPVLLKNNLTPLQIAQFSINQYRFPGIEINNYQQRYYPYSTALTHVIGYVSKINDRDLRQLDKANKLANYAATHDIGKLGIERYYEDLLHGQTGYEEVEVNSHGRVVRQLRQQLPQAGNDIHLTINLALQQYIEQLLAGSRAAVIVTDPRTGEILAMVSNPSYDANLFVDGISSANYSRLLNDKNHPLINRATQGLYPPASTVKPYIAVAALESGVITKNTSLFDPGWWQLPGSKKRYRDWKRWGHGQLNVNKAITESADTFFYQVAYDMGIDRLSSWMSKFGYGHLSGIDIYEERTGVMPTREWKMNRYHKPWYQGDTIPVGIGQGYWIATPIQMNKALMTLINDGKVQVPHLLKSIQSNHQLIPYKMPEQPSLSYINDAFWQIAKAGMHGVADRPNGTAFRDFSSAPYQIAAKSGTAQVFGLKENEVYNAKKIPERLRDHKLMSAFAPFEAPQVAVTVVLENGGAGATVGRLTRQILDHIMLGDNNTDLPVAAPSPPGFEGD